VQFVSQRDVLKMNIFHWMISAGPFKHLTEKQNQTSICEKQ
jgi:hypothetical protein